MAQAPIAVGERLELEIADLNHDGDGVGRAAGGFVLFVPEALPGDRARVEVTRLKRGHGEAKLVSVREPSEARRTAPCPIASACGGCRMQHLSYDEQLRWKGRRVRTALKRIGGLSGVDVLPTMGMSHPYAYRNHAQVPVGRRRSGEVVLGFYRRGSHEIVPSDDDCLIQHPTIAKIVSAAKRQIEGLDLSVSDGRSGTGLVHRVVARVGVFTGEAMACLVTSTEPFPERDAWVRGMREAVPEVKSLVQMVEPRRERRLLSGEAHITESLAGVEFLISPGAFFQVNSAQAVRLYDVVKAYAGLSGGETVWDVYCGTGSIGLYVTADGGRTSGDRSAGSSGGRGPYRVRGVEMNGQAVQDARKNAELNGVLGARFEVGRAEKVLPRWAAEGGRPDVCLLDPPRAGCDRAALAAIVQAAPRHIVYVSCNPSTLARDLAYLQAQGYTPREVQPVDMFPQTPHIEAVASLEAS